MKTRFTILSSAILITLVVTGLLALNVSFSLAQDRNGFGSRNDEAVYAPIKKVPAKARARQNPLAGDSDALAAGGKLYEEHCEECHGMKAEGTERGPSLLKEQVQQATPGALFWILSNGVIRHGMPDWSKVPEPERWQIITFLKSFKASAVSQATTASQ
jgi:mono/diheme cytochrome c family protein